MINKLKMLLSFLLATVFIISSVPTFAFEKEMDVEVFSKGRADGLTFEGKNVTATDAWYKDKQGVDQPAYCINPNLAGVGEAGNYDVNVNGAFSDPKVVGMVLNGFPYKTASELGLKNNEEAFTVTKSAIWAYLSGSRYNGISKWGAISGKEYMLTAMKQVYNDGIKNTTLKPSYASTKAFPESQKEAILEDNGEYLSQIREVETNYPLKSYRVEFVGSVPEGTQITDESNNPKTEFLKDEKFKIRIPKASLQPNDSGIVATEIEANVESSVLLYGKALKVGVQNYAVSMPIQPVWTPAKTPYSTTTETGTPPPTETPTPTPPPKTPGKLKIVKVEAGTTIPLAGQSFV